MNDTHTTNPPPPLTIGREEKRKEEKKVQSWPDPDGLYSYHPDNERDDPSDHGVNERRTT